MSAGDFGAVLGKCGRCAQCQLRLHYQTPNQQNRDEAEVGQTLWLTTDVARQFISILEAGIAKIESGDYQENEYKRH